MIRKIVLPWLLCGTLVFILLGMPAHAGAGTPVAGLKCEHLVNPIGIDAPQPRFSWLMTATKQGMAQGAYRLFVGTDPAGVATGKAVYWASLKLVSSSNLATYKGKPLQPFTTYYWRVELWDGAGKLLGSSALARFETGMMQERNWKGAWISDENGIAVKPAPYFRYTFNVAKKIASARAYMAAAGLYELYINGQKIGNHRLDPMYTRFDRRNLYVTYDITGALQSGVNALGVLLGNGWYNHQSTAVWDLHRAPWRARPAFCLDVRVTYEDGSVETVSSGKSWKTALSPVIFNSIYTAEHYDARLEQEGWNKPGFDDAKWKTVALRAAPSQTIVAQTLHPIRNVETIPARFFKKLDGATWVFDLERNIAGVSQLTVSGAAGTVIHLKHGERLYPNGRVDQSNIDVHYRPQDSTDPFQTDIFILSGKGTEIFMPRFNYKGFQYVEVTASVPVELSGESLTGYFMHSDVPVAGHIRSSNPTLDKIWQATNNSYLSNLFGYPTDCPQREKNGWTGDGHFALETGLYNFDGITVYEKWLADHRDEQQPNGVLPSIIPTGGWGYEWGNGPDWTSTIAIIPWNLYLFYGDSKPLADCYQNIRKYVDYIDAHYPSGLTSWGLGDWIPVSSKAQVELTSTAYYFTDVVILAKAAKLFGKTSDYTKYNSLAAKIKSAFNAKYFNAATSIYGTGIQTEMSVPLYLGLVPEGKKEVVAANLVKRIQADSNKLDVGLLGTKAILNALSENGYGDVAYTLAAREEYPSWGWWIVNGATTLYENWPIDAKSDISMNHIMFGEIGAWFYKALGGIKPDERHPGFKNVLLRPHFVTGLNHFEASYKSPFGKIRSFWKRDGTTVTWQVVVPPNASATIHFPEGQVSVQSKRLATSKPYEVKSGSYIFEIITP
jgi:alpha-L-rhamnosidase